MTVSVGASTLRMVDLTMPMDPTFPCSWPELDAFSVSESMTLAEHNIACRRLCLEEHSGTHMDAPRHIGDEDRRPVDPRGADEVPLLSMWGRARVIDATDVVGAELGISPWVDADYITRYEQRTEPLAPGDAVLLFTGWSARFFVPFPAGDGYISDPLNGRAPGWPAPTAAFVEAIADRGVTVLGMDTPTMSAVQDAFTNHRAAFRRGVTPIENLVGLSNDIDRTAHFVFLPLRVVGGSGAPGRAIALLHDPAGQGDTQ